MAAETFEPYHQQEGGGPQKECHPWTGQLNPPKKKEKRGGSLVLRSVPNLVTLAGTYACYHRTNKGMKPSVDFSYNTTQSPSIYVNKSSESMTVYTSSWAGRFHKKKGGILFLKYILFPPSWVPSRWKEEKKEGGVAATKQWNITNSTKEGSCIELHSRKENVNHKDEE